VSTTVVLAGALAASGESKKSGPIGLAVILVLCVACYFLFKSMSKHLRRVREEFPTDAPPQGGELSPAPARPPLTKPLDEAPANDVAALPPPPAPPPPPGDPA
jgi:hypothetical protein